MGMTMGKIEKEKEEEARHMSRILKPRIALINKCFTSKNALNCAICGRSGLFFFFLRRFYLRLSLVSSFPPPSLRPSPSFFASLPPLDCRPSPFFRPGFIALLFLRLSRIAVFFTLPKCPTCSWKLSRMRVSVTFSFLLPSLSRHHKAFIALLDLAKFPTSIHIPYGTYTQTQ